MLASDDQSTRWKRDQELRVDRLEQGEIEIARADQFAELVGVGHEEGLHQAVDQQVVARKRKNSYLPQPVSGPIMRRVVKEIR